MGGPDATDVQPLNPACANRSVLQPRRESESLVQRGPVRRPRLGSRRRRLGPDAISSFADPAAALAAEPAGAHGEVLQPLAHPLRDATGSRRGAELLEHRQHVIGQPRFDDPVTDPAIDGDAVHRRRAVRGGEPSEVPAVRAACPPAGHNLVVVLEDVVVFQTEVRERFALRRDQPLEGVRAPDVLGRGVMADEGGIDVLVDQPNSPPFQTSCIKRRVTAT